MRVTTESGQTYTFDLLIGSDGLKSVVRRVLFPDVKPRAATNNAAYRSVIPYEELWQKVPESREFGNNIDVWSVEKGYMITYPISAGRDWNTVCMVMANGWLDPFDCHLEFHLSARPWIRLRKLLTILPITFRS